MGGGRVIGGKWVSGGRKGGGEVGERGEEG